jgi:hypothetical protein
MSSGRESGWPRSRSAARCCRNRVEGGAGVACELGYFAPGLDSIRRQRLAALEWDKTHPVRPNRDEFTREILPRLDGVSYSPLSCASGLSRPLLQADCDRPRQHSYLANTRFAANSKVSTVVFSQWKMEGLERRCPARTGRGRRCGYSWSTTRSSFRPRADDLPRSKVPDRLDHPPHRDQRRRHGRSQGPDRRRALHRTTTRVLRPPRKAGEGRRRGPTRIVNYPTRRPGRLTGSRAGADPF